MSAELAAGILFGMFIFFVLLRVPVGFALGLACLPVVLLEPRISMFAVVDKAITAYNSFLLLSVPFFLLAAKLMNSTGITDRLMDLSRVIVGHLPGGLGHINVMVSMLFAGTSGSSSADAAGVGGVLIPSMIKEGFSRRFSVAITACSSVMGVIIPPSILMLIWGGTMSVSVAALFLAGVIPGIALGLSMMVTTYFYAKRYNYPLYPRANFKQVTVALVRSVLPLLTPAIIVGGITFGIFTPTESSAIAVLYALFLGVGLYRTLGPKKLLEVLVETAHFSAVTLLCVGTASAFSWLLAYYKVPTMLVQSMSGLGLSGWQMALMIAFAFLVTGLFIDSIPAIIVMGTILAPVAQTAGIHPVHFAIIGVVSLAFGLVTPPYGICLLISSAIAELEVRKALKDVFIVLAPMLLVLLIITLFPEVILFLPRWLTPQFLGAG